MNPSIVAAIERREKLIIDYGVGVRIIEPHTYGESGDGNPLLRAFQVEGASESGEPRNWKLFRVDRIRNVNAANENFEGPRPGYRKGDSVMAVIYIEL